MNSKGHEFRVRKGVEMNKDVPRIAINANYNTELGLMINSPKLQSLLPTLSRTGIPNQTTGNRFSQLKKAGQNITGFVFKFKTQKVKKCLSAKILERVESNEALRRDEIIRIRTGKKLSGKNPKEKFFFSPYLGPISPKGEDRYKLADSIESKISSSGLSSIEEPC